MSKKKTYKITKNPPLGWSWEKYESFLLKKLPEELIKHKAEEEEIQIFLENYACLVPQLHGHHNPIHSVLISQPPLPGIKKKIPDFMWLEKHSASFFPNLIEIEAPQKPWVTKKGHQSAKLTQAIDQLKDWQAYFDEEANSLNFKKIYALSKTVIYLSFDPKFTLIYGRRDQAQKFQNFSKKRSKLEGLNEMFMTYDRLQPNRYLKNIPTVKVDQRSVYTKFRVINIPPTFKLGPQMANDWSKLHSRKKAIDRNKLISDERKKFLKERTEYWDEWVEKNSQNKTLNFVHSKDWE